MSETRSGFAPRLRNGEVMPEAPEGKAVTRVLGKLVFVSAKQPEEPYVGKSAYTEKQLGEITQILLQLRSERTKKERRVPFGVFYED